VCAAGHGAQVVAVCIERGQLEAAAEQGVARLDETQQPLPPELASALQDALGAGAPDAFTRVLNLEAAAGYI